MDFRFFGPLVEFLETHENVSYDDILELYTEMKKFENVALYTKEELSIMHVTRLYGLAVNVQNQVLRDSFERKTGRSDRLRTER